LYDAIFSELHLVLSGILSLHLEQIFSEWRIRDWQDMERSIHETEGVVAGLFFNSKLNLQHWPRYGLRACGYGPKFWDEMHV